MKNFLCIIFIVVFGAGIFGSESAIRITNGEWEPYLSENVYEYGFGSHIVTEALKLENIEIEWAFFPWKRSYEMAKNGTWDASALWWSSEETKVDFLLSDPVMNTSFAFFHRKDMNFDWNSIKDLKGLRIGITSGYDYGEEFMTAMKNGEIKVEIANTDEQNFKKLLAGRIDIFPNDPIVGSAQIRNTFKPKKAKLLGKHNKEFEKSMLFLIVSKKSEKKKFYLEKFNSGFKKLKESGKLDQMYKDLEDGKYDK